MDTQTTSPTPEPQVVFRGKKRKAYRQRTETDDRDEATTRGATPVAPSHNGNGTTDPTTGPSSAPSDPSAPAATATSPGQENGKKTAKEEQEEEEEKGLSVAEVLRLRNARKSRLGGVKFSAVDSAGSRGTADGQTGGEDDINGNMDDLSLMIREEESRVVERSTTAAAGVKGRFAPQTGLSSELINKHMEQYIEAELAKRHAASSAALSSSSTADATAAAISQWQQDRNSSSSFNGAPGDASADKIYEEFARTGKLTAARLPTERHTALQGKLLEVDLGDEMRSRNAAMTERAARRLLGEGEVDDDDDDDGLEGDGRNTKKVRLGRDGKPWRPRNRRGSDDVKRDRIVEELLRENRFDVYENPTPPAGTSNDKKDATAHAGASNANNNNNKNNEDGGAAGPDPDQAADDRIAEEFRREFLEAMAERRQRRRAPLANPHFVRGKSGQGRGGAGGPGGKDAETVEVLRGPKLGGSRNARAAMRDILLQQEREKLAAGGPSGKAAGGMHSIGNKRTGGRPGGRR